LVEELKAVLAPRRDWSQSGGKTMSSIIAGPCLALLHR